MNQPDDEAAEPPDPADPVSADVLPSSDPPSSFSDGPSTGLDLSELKVWTR